MQVVYVCVFCNDPATTEIYTYWHPLSLPDALPFLCWPPLCVCTAGSAPCQWARSPVAASKPPLPSPSGTDTPFCAAARAAACAACCAAMAAAALPKLLTERFSFCRACCCCRAAAFAPASMPLGSLPVAAACDCAAPLAAIQPLLKGRDCACTSFPAKLPPIASTHNPQAKGVRRGRPPPCLNCRPHIRHPALREN